MKARRLIMRRYLVVAGCLVVLSAGRCQADDTQTELRAIRDQLAHIRREQQQLAAAVDALRVALSGKDAPPGGVALNIVSTSTRNLPSRGKETARVGVMEFSDYQCAYCREYFINTMPLLEEKYIKAGKIRYYVHNFPLSAIHPQAERMAEASHCAAEVGRYWEVRDSLFTNQEGDFESSMRAAISAADRARFDRCLSEARYAGRVREDVNEGKRLGIDGTPTFLVGYLDDSDHPGELKCVRRLVGAVRADEIAGAIEGVLAAAPPNSAVPGQAIPSAPGYNDPVSESPFKAFVGGPVSTVRAEDLRRVWSFLASQHSEAQAQASVSLNIVAGLCEPKADALAVWLRVTLIRVLLQRGRLDRWRDGSTLRDKVFEVAAKFPLPNGSAQADLDAFVAAMQ